MVRTYVSPIARIPNSPFYYYYQKWDDGDEITTVCQNKNIYGGAICNDYNSIRNDWEVLIDDFKWVLRMARRGKRERTGGFWNRIINKLSYFWHGEYDGGIR